MCMPSIHTVNGLITHDHLGRYFGVEFASSTHGLWDYQFCEGDRFVRRLAFLTIRTYRPPTSSTECLGIHIGDPQSANLGDGNGFRNQTVHFVFQRPRIG